MEQSIALYENVAVIFGIAAVVFLIVSLVLYFKFDMKSIISKRLGLSEKRALKRMQADAEAAEQAAKKRVQGAANISSGAAPTGDVRQKQSHSDAGQKKRESILATLAAEQENERLMQMAMAASASKNTGYAGGVGDSETTQLGLDSETSKLDLDSETMQLGLDIETTSLVEDEGTIKLSGDDETTRLYTSDEVSKRPYSGSQNGSWQQRQLTDAPDGMELEESGDTVVLHEEAETAVLSQNAPSYSNKQFMLIRHIMLIHTDEVIA